MAHQTDIQVLDIGVDLGPGNDKVPVSSQVQTFRARITDAALAKAVQAVLTMARPKMPFEVEFESAVFVPGGAEITVQAGAGRFLRAKGTAVLGFSGDGADKIAVEVKEVRALGKLPIEGIVAPFIDKGLDRATTYPGIQRDSSRHRGLLIEPNVLLASQGVPLDFKSAGTWTTNYGSGWMETAFTANE
jgi:hypothetical protein